MDLFCGDLLAIRALVIFQRRRLCFKIAINKYSLFGNVADFHLFTVM